MKLKKILAAVAAAAFAVSAMAVSAFALSGKDYVKNAGNGLNTIYIQADKASDPSWVNDSGVAITEVYGAKFHITGKGDWYGGKVCLNSNSTGWKEIDEWDNGSKPIVEVDGVVTYLADKPLFAASDAYAQIILMVYDSSDVTVNTVEILGKDGVVISTEDAAPAEEEAAPAETEAAEEEKEEAAPAEEEAEAEAEDEDVDEPEAEEEEEEEASEPAPVAETEAAPVEEAPAVANATEAPATGNTAAATVVAVMAVAGAAAIVSKKRK